VAVGIAEVSIFFEIAEFFRRVKLFEKKEIDIALCYGLNKV